MTAEGQEVLFKEKNRGLCRKSKDEKEFIIN